MKKKLSSVEIEQRQHGLIDALERGETIELDPYIDHPAIHFCRQHGAKIRQETSNLYFAWLPNKKRCCGGN